MAVRLHAAHDLGVSKLVGNKQKALGKGSWWSLSSCPHPRYEDEINKRTAAENDFVVLKKVSQEGRRKIL